MDKMDKNNEDIYSSLKGYFPEEYDMSPDELEKAIETEDKENNIALGMTDPGKSKLTFGNSVDEIISIESEDEPKNLSVEVSSQIDEKISVAPAPVNEEVRTWDIPDAEDVTTNELLKNHDSLDDLFKELEAEESSTDTEQSEDDTEPDEKSGNENAIKTIDWFFDFLEVFTICLACIILFFSFIARLTRVDGISMNDTLIDGEYLVVSDLFYKPAAGDIVVLQNTSLEMEELKKPLVKRIIAVGGETVRVRIDGSVTVTDKDGNIKELDQSFTKNEPYLSGEYNVTVPEGHVFVMGDNRNHSTDSRSSHVGVVDERCIFGKAYMRILPISEFTLFKNPYTEK